MPSKRNTILKKMEKIMILDTAISSDDKSQVRYRSRRSISVALFICYRQTFPSKLDIAPCYKACGWGGPEICNCFFVEFSWNPIYWVYLAAWTWPYDKISGQGKIMREGKKGRLRPVILPQRLKSVLRLVTLKKKKNRSFHFARLFKKYYVLRWHL